MKKSLITLVLFLTSQSYGAALHLKMEMEIEQEKFNPSVTVNEDEWIDLEQGEFTLRLKATKVQADAVKIRAEIARIEGTSIDLIARPTLLTPFDSPAEITVADDSGHQRLRFKVTPSALP